MPIAVKVPKLGSSGKSGVLVRWLKEVGSFVAEGEAIAEIETEKITLDVEAPAAGMIMIHYVSEEEIFSLDAVIALIEVV